MYSKISINSKTLWENTSKNSVKTFLAMPQGYRDSLDNASRVLDTHLNNLGDHHRTFPSRKLDVFIGCVMLKTLQEYCMAVS